MSNEEKITGLTFTISSGVNEENRYFSNSNFNFSGNMSIDNAEKLVRNFKDIFSEHENKYTDNDNKSENESKNLHEIKEDSLLESSEDLEDNNYPIFGNVMSFNYIKHSKEIIKSAWDRYGSVLIESQKPIKCGNKTISYYRVVFPTSSVQEMSLNEDSNVIYLDRGFPICSCPSYYYKSYKYSKYESDPYVNVSCVGMCKHIDEILHTLGVDIEDINWSLRKDYLPFLMKQKGLEEYQWIPNPSL